MLRYRATAPLGVAGLLIVLLFAAISVAAPRAYSDTSFTFTAAGDFGKNANTDGVLGGIAASGSQFTLALGDLSYGAILPESAWCSYVTGKVGANYPFELISGNHEMDGQWAGNHINNFVTCLPNRLGNLT